MEELIIKNIILNEPYSKQVLPYISINYFNDNYNKKIIKILLHYYKTYSKIPSFDEIEFDIKKNTAENISEEIINKLNFIKEVNNEFANPKLIDETEKYFRLMGLNNSIIECATIIEERKEEKYNSFPSLIKEALSISFDHRIGIDFKDSQDIKKRFEAYMSRPEKILLGTRLFNYVTDGGYERKTLNVYISPTNVGKTWKMVDDAAYLFKNGYNVLYVTLEMAETKITQRIETNLFELPTKDFKNLTWETYKGKLKSIKPNPEKSLGRIIVTEFPSSKVNVGHIEILLNDLELKRNFVPDILIVDYLGLMIPQDDRYGNIYEKIKNIAEELRGLAVTNNICIISAVQTNRSGYDVSDFGLSSVAESMSIAHTSDFIAGIIDDSDLSEIEQIWIKVLKNRYTDIKNKKFTIGTNLKLQKFIDVEQNESSDFMEEMLNTSIIENPSKPRNFEGLKI